MSKLNTLRAHLSRLLKIYKIEVDKGIATPTDRLVIDSAYMALVQELVAALAAHNERMNNEYSL